MASIAELTTEQLEAIAERVTLTAFASEQERVPLPPERGVWVGEINEVVDLRTGEEVYADN